MDRIATLARYDAEMRRDPPHEPGERVEREGTIVRVVGDRSWIAFSQLSTETAARAVEAEAAQVRSRHLPLEWKLYGHDPPPSLGRLLEEHGFVADPPETLMALDLHDPFDAGPLSGRATIEQVRDAAGLERAVRVSREAFVPRPGWDLAEYLPRLGTPSFAVFLASMDGQPASAGQLELPEGRTFASIWGGGTAPEFRGVGVYRGLVAARAKFARARGYRYLTQDALETSRPILERIGFHPLAPVTGWVLTP
jgi:GNAT superfamily N-acetyltransferase